MSEEHVNIDSHIISRRNTPFKSDAEKDSFIEKAMAAWLAKGIKCRACYQVFWGERW